MIAYYSKVIRLNYEEMPNAYKKQKKFNSQMNMKSLTGKTTILENVLSTFSRVPCYQYVRGSWSTTLLDIIWVLSESLWNCMEIFQEASYLNNYKRPGYQYLKTQKVPKCTSVPKGSLDILVAGYLELSARFRHKYSRIPS